MLDALTALELDLGLSGSPEICRLLAQDWVQILTILRHASKHDLDRWYIEFSSNEGLTKNTEFSC